MAAPYPVDIPQPIRQTLSNGAVESIWSQNRFFSCYYIFAQPSVKLKLKFDAECKQTNVCWSKIFKFIMCPISVVHALWEIILPYWIFTFLYLFFFNAEDVRKENKNVNLWNGGSGNHGIFTECTTSQEMIHWLTLARKPRASIWHLASSQGFPITKTIVGAIFHNTYN